MSTDLSQGNHEQERVEKIARDFFSLMSQLEKEEREIVAQAMKELDHRRIAEIHQQLNASYEHRTKEQS